MKTAGRRTSKNVLVLKAGQKLLDPFPKSYASRNRKTDKLLDQGRQVNKGQSSRDLRKKDIKNIKRLESRPEAPMKSAKSPVVESFIGQGALHIAKRNLNFPTQKSLVGRKSGRKK